MSLATGPSISCQRGFAPVAIIASDGVRPIQNAKVTLFLTYSVALFVFDSKQIDLTTSIAGIAEFCVENKLTKSYAVEAWIRKSNVDFGSGPGNPHRIGAVTGLIRATTPFTLFTAIAAPTIPPIPEIPTIPPIPEIPTIPPIPEIPTIPEIPPIPEIPHIPEIPSPPSVCTAWDTVATPNVPTTLSTSFPISVSGAKWECKDFDASELINGMGKIEFGGRTFDLPIQNGYGRVNLEDLMDLSTLTGLPTAPTAPTVPTVPIVPETIIPPGISPYEPGSTTVTLYLNDYLRRKIYTPIRGAYWGAGYFSRAAGHYTIHKADDARGTGDKVGIPCELNKPKTHRYFGDYTVTVLSVQNLGLPNASYTVKIKL